MPREKATQLSTNTTTGTRSLTVARQQARDFSSLSSIDDLAANSAMDQDLIECLISSLESKTDDSGKTIDFDSIANNMDFELLSQFLASPTNNVRPGGTTTNTSTNTKPFTFEQAVEELLLPLSPESLSGTSDSISGTGDSLSGNGDPLSGCSDLLSLSDEELFGDTCSGWESSFGDLFPSLTV